MSVFDVLLMVQSMSHISVGDRTLIINVSGFKSWQQTKGSRSLPTLLSPFLQTRPQLPESRAAKSHMMLKFAYQKKIKKTALPPPSLFVCVNCFWLSARKPASACACCATFPHQSTPPSLIPSCPWRKTKLACLFNEEQGSERGEGALFFHTH